MGKTVAAAAACAAVAFVVAFYAAGAGTSPKRRTVTYEVAARFAAPGAGTVADSISGGPNALHLPPRPVTHHRHKPAATKVIIKRVQVPRATTTTTQAHVTPPPPKRKRNGGGGTGTGTTVVGP